MNIPLTLNLHKLSLLPQKPQITNDHENAWNSVIKHHAKLKNDHAILSTYTQMESQGIVPNSATLPLVFKACARLSAVERGKSIHWSIRNTDSIQDVRVGTALIDFYSKCGFLEEARNVFDKMTERDVVSWNAMISGYSGSGGWEQAILLFREMYGEGLKPNSHTVLALLLACGEAFEMRLGQEIHGYCLRNGLFYSNPHVGTALTGFYLNFDVRISLLVFDSIVMKNTVSWNAMITGYFDYGDTSDAWKLFIQMLMDGVKFDSVTMLVVIQACAEFGFQKLGMQIHQMAIKFDYSNDLYIRNAMINMYSDIGCLESSCTLFDTNHNRDVALWNSMISIFSAYGYYEEATSMFVKMRNEGVRENERTIIIMLSICPEITDGLRKGKSLHAHAIKSKMSMDFLLGNALLSMYAEGQCVKSAKTVFVEMSSVNIVSYNTLVLALALNNLLGEAWELFQKMQESETRPNSYTVISILAACKDDTYLNIGRAVHGFVIKHNIEVNPELSTALCDMYINCGDEATARNLFEECPGRDLISWNAIIASYIRNSQTQEALLLFNRMVSEVDPNSVTIISILSSCTHLSNLPHGRCLHAYSIRRDSSFEFNLTLQNAFITMYGRCGSMENAEKIFEILPRRNIISWNAIITGYGMHGRGYDAICAFLQMLEEGFQPNGVTFVSILSACSHSGFTEMGMQLFYSMVQNFNITPELAHYGCVVDLLGRGGYLDEAKEFIDYMPIEPDASVWRALLGACRVHSTTKNASLIFDKLIELEPTNAGNYVLLSNIYAAAGLWSEVGYLRSQLRGKGLKKPPGISWIVIRNQIYYFTVRDRSHPLSNTIYANLSSLLTSMKEAGYAPDCHCVLHDEED